MEPKRGFQFPFSFLLILCLLFFASACSKAKPGVENSPQPPGVEEPRAESAIPERMSTGPAWPALALLKTGENPIWFELGPDGPELIDSPAAASLSPFTPWPHARFVTGMRLWRNYLVMALNRFGFLVLESADAARAADLTLYKAADSAQWDPYTAGSFFVWDDKPSVLLYRNDFFSEPAPHPPKSQVYVLDESSAVPLGASFPVLEDLPADGSREAELLRRGNDAFWYYRVSEKGSAENETVYFRSESPSGKGEEISAGEWRASERPEAPESSSPLLAALLKRTEEFGLAGVSAVRAVSPDFEGERFLSAGAPSAFAGTENLNPAFAYSRETPEPLALVMRPDGRGLFFRGAETVPSGARIRPFSLPAMGEGFVYSGAAVLGDALVASWEEQRDAGIGAAGFMVLSLDAALSAK